MGGVPSELDTVSWRQKTSVLVGGGGVCSVSGQMEMVGWHHRLDGHEFEHAPAHGEGQGSLACCSSWGLKESDTTE